MQMPFYRLVVVAQVSLLSGCGLLFNNDLIGGEDAYFRDRGQDYEQSHESKLLLVPPHLDSTKVKQRLIVPDIGSAAIDSDQQFEIPRPDFFAAEAGNDKVNLARDGQERLIIVNEASPQVWTKLQAFWRSHSQEIAVSDPKRGLMETAWIDSGEEGPGFISRLVARLTFSEVEGPAQDKLRAYLRPVEGDSNKTSIRLQHLRAAVSDPGQVADWSIDAQHVDYKSQVMYEILHYLSQSSEETTASAARERQKQQGRVFFGRGAKGEPVLKLTLSVDDAWTQIGQALAQAQVDVGSSNRQLGRFYISYASPVAVSDEESSGFFAWLHGDREDIKIGTSVFSSALGIESEENNSGPRYSAKSSGADEAGIALQDAASGEQPLLPEGDGYKIWLGDKVIYVFGGESSAEEKISVNPASGVAESSGRYQVKLTRRSSGVYVSVLTSCHQSRVLFFRSSCQWNKR